MLTDAVARRYSMNPWTDWSREWIRPWKLATLACGLALLCWGAIEERLADWDIGLSFLMGLLTYLFAPWTIQVVRLAIATRPRGWWWHLAVAAFTAWAVTDGSYVGYSLLMGS